MSSAERKTTGSTFHALIGCVVKTKERLHEQRRKEDNWVNLMIGCVVKTKDPIMSSAERISCLPFCNWVNLT